MTNPTATLAECLRVHGAVTSAEVEELSAALADGTGGGEAAAVGASGPSLWDALELVRSGGASARSISLGLPDGGGSGGQGGRPGSCPWPTLLAEQGAAAAEALLDAGWLEVGAQTPQGLAAAAGARRTAGAALPLPLPLPAVKVGNGWQSGLLSSAALSVRCRPLLRAALDMVRGESGVDATAWPAVAAAVPVGLRERVATAGEWQQLVAQAEQLRLDEDELRVDEHALLELVHTVGPRIFEPSKEDQLRVILELQYRERGMEDRRQEVRARTRRLVTTRDDLRAEMQAQA